MPVIVLVDTNVWVSALINPRGYPAKVLQAWLDGRFDVTVSLPLLEELAEVLHRPRIRRKYDLTDEDIQQLLVLLASQVIQVQPTGTLKVCRDPDDDLVLETAVLGKASYAVSRDDDLKMDDDLVVQMQARGIAVLSVRQFLDRLETDRL